MPYLPPFAGAQNLPVTTNASREEHDVDQTVVVSANTVLGNTRLNTIRVNFTREDVAFANPGFNGNGQDQAALDPQLVFLTYVDQQNNVAQARVNDAYQIDDTMSWFITGHGGSHDLKFGLQYQYVGARSTAQDNLNGTFFFRSDAAFNAASGSTYPERLQIRVPNALNSYQKAHFGSVFVQDKWHLSSRATISAGLRYDLEVQPFNERDNPAFSDPTAYPLDTNNFAPRLGMTYDLSGDGRAVARGGYGRFYDKTHFELISGILTNGVFSDSFQVFFPTNNADPGPSNGTRAHWIRCWRAAPPSIARSSKSATPPVPASATPARSCSTTRIGEFPYTDQFTAGYERQLASNLSTSADYVHARARDQLMLQDLNPGLRATTARTSTLVRVNPAFVGAGEHAGERRLDRLRRPRRWRWSSGSRRATPSASRTRSAIRAATRRAWEPRPARSRCSTT